MIEPLTIQKVTYQEAIAPIQAIRRQVFAIEQGIPPELEFDGEDGSAIHFLAYLGEIAVGTTRIRTVGKAADTKLIAKIERVAVLKDYRGRGIGRRLVKEAIASLHQQGITHIKLNAQQSVQHFYRSLDFQPDGEPFMEAGIEHIRMWYQPMSSN